MLEYPTEGFITLEIFAAAHYHAHEVVRNRSTGAYLQINEQKDIFLHRSIFNPPALPCSGICVSVPCKHSGKLKLYG